MCERRASVSGAVLAALCAERAGSCGLLLGCALRREEERLTDTAATILSSRCTTHVQRYLLTNSKTASEAPEATEVVGVFAVRDFGTSQPSFREVLFAAALLDAAPEHAAALLVLVITLPSSPGLWIYSMKYACFYVTRESRAPVPVEVEVPNLSDSKSDKYKGSGCPASAVGGARAVALQASARALSVQQCVCSDLRNYALVDEAVALAAETQRLEQEVAELETLLKDALVDNSMMV